MKFMTLRTSGCTILCLELPSEMTAQMSQPNQKGADCHADWRCADAGCARFLVTHRVLVVSKKDLITVTINTTRCLELPSEMIAQMSQPDRRCANCHAYCRCANNRASCPLGNAPTDMLPVLRCRCHVVALHGAAGIFINDSLLATRKKWMHRSHARD